MCFFSQLKLKNTNQTNNIHFVKTKNNQSVNLTKDYFNTKIYKACSFFNGYFNYK